MDTETALAYLSANQPLPPDEFVDTTMFNDILEYFCDHLDARCVPLILNAFGDGCGNEVYQFAVHTLVKYPTEVVLAALSQSLQNPLGGVQRWSAVIAREIFPGQISLLKSLIPLLAAEDLDTRAEGVAAICIYQKSLIGNVLRQHLPRENHPGIATFITNALQE